MNEADSLTNENTAVPVLYTSYDADAQGRTVDTVNMMRLMNHHKTLLTPYKSKALTIKPIWDMAPTKFGDVTTFVRRVDNPWFDTALLVNHQTKAPSIRSQNGQLCILEHCMNRVVTKHMYYSI